ncbi:Fructose-1,6-bisphosphatase, cytosolic [Sphaceloma murrayae]|uniref:Fructose-1,6-bisphosphatase, cytosolic n=1 Tax=Sphaceloma murrayae TaxID=2082308 RepID=A0A2K1QXR9_9PEZI|nr:Fructose-1,6-bisphosphatase, cytosolic [Sphaceloma murrayae]
MASAATSASEDYQQLQAHLATVLPAELRPNLCRSILPNLIDCISQIAVVLRKSHQVSQVGTANAFGDDQLNVDVLSEDIIRDSITSCPSLVTASSEEDPVEKSSSSHAETAIDTGASSERYTIAFDPLDGSSIIAPNWSVGTIIGIWDGVSALRQDPNKQVAAILGLYGPRTTAVIAIRTDSVSTCFELGIGDGTCEVIRPEVRLSSPPFRTRYFAPANLRAAADDEAYLHLITHYISSKYTLRYSGGLVPDVIHALVKGHGLYISPVTEKSSAKLRRLYELAPVALIVETAGGKAVDAATGKRILEHVIEDCDERAGIICGNAEEVDFALQHFGL